MVTKVVEVVVITNADVVVVVVKMVVVVTSSYSPTSIHPLNRTDTKRISQIERYLNFIFSHLIYKFQAIYSEKKNLHALQHLNSLIHRRMGIKQTDHSFP